MGSIEINTTLQRVQSQEEHISVFDLPSLRTKPTYEQLLGALEALEIKPSSWKKPRFKRRMPSDETAISRYLMAIISNLFHWFDATTDEELAMEQKEILWDLASKRVVERCGRSAMSEINRTWEIPASANIPELHFKIREPPLTGDNLGLKTWGTAYAIAKKLEYFGNNYVHHLLDDRRTRVLELGAGTGLVGIAAAAIWSASVILTDLEEIKANLLHNIQDNMSLVDQRGGKISGGVLDWKNTQKSSAAFSSEDFQIIIAADCLYDYEHPSLVANMIKKHLKRDTQSRALVAVPIRDDKTKLMALQLQQILAKNKYKLFDEGWEICIDDWEGTYEDEEAKCWWGIFGLAISELT